MDSCYYYIRYLFSRKTIHDVFLCFSFRLERFVAVYSPFLAKRFCTIDSARYSIYILLAFATFLFTAIFPVTHHIVTTPTNVKCSLRLSGSLIIRIYQPILFYAIPDLLLLSNLFTVAALCQRTHRLASTYANETENAELRVCDVNSNRKQRQLTIMLVTISLSFYLFTTPALVAFIIQQIIPKNRTVHQIKHTFLLQQISVIFLQLNNAVSELKIDQINSILWSFRRTSSSIALPVNVFAEQQCKCSPNIHRTCKLSIIDIFFAIDNILQHPCLNFNQMLWHIQQPLVEAPVLQILMSILSIPSIAIITIGTSIRELQQCKSHF